jgi:mannosyltransferase OCH1-like enzyme
VYMDATMQIADLNAVLSEYSKSNTRHVLISVRDRTPSSIYQAFLASTRHNPLMLTMLNAITDNILNGEYEHEMLSVTGPGIVGQLVREGGNIDGDLPVFQSFSVNNADVYLLQHDHEGGLVRGKNGDRLIVTKYEGFLKEARTRDHYSYLFMNNQIVHKNHILHQPFPMPFAQNERISCLLFQTWESEYCAKSVYEATQTWKSTLPAHWKHVFHDAQMRRHFIASQMPPEVLVAYDTLLPGAYRADLWRLCVLYVHGGMYIDIDMMSTPCTVSHLLPLVEQHKFVCSVDCNGERLMNGFMAACALEPALLSTINSIVKSVMYGDIPSSDLSLTGPNCFTAAVNKHWNWRQQDENEHLAVLKTESNSWIVDDEGRQLIRMKHPDYDGDKHQTSNSNWSKCFSSRNIYRSDALTSIICAK